MFSKILIANRGEIACRVIRTARKMGIATVAVYSDADKDALHVEMADEAVRIGPPPVAESYLLIDRIIEACRETSAEAVHPGYGFLSENAKFAEALDAAGIAFIGPPTNAIEAMGDKIESKKVADAAGVSTVPGYLGVIEDSEQAVRIAEDIGYPVMIKASAGGGGKGMRVAYDAKEVTEGFTRSKSEARSSFGDDRVFVEKFIENPRHVEIQVLGDKHGNVVYLGERECSIQRRNQKVVEEAPSPLLDPATRKAMGEQSVALAKAVGYFSAGTVEFVAGQDKSFYFLEMNTRLQVEHPVTELVTGIDLVEQMIRVAAGEPLPFAQDDIVLDGWAIESRVYAEDPYRNFLPSIGRLVRLQAPQEGTDDEGLTVRVDTGVQEGGEISMFYDPMIAKLVTHGPDRESAIRHMSKALDSYYIDGIQQNIPFLSALMDHPRWIAGNLSTGFISEEYPDGFHPRDPDRQAERVICAVAACVDHLQNSRRRSITGQMTVGGYRFPSRRVVRLDGREVMLSVSGEFPDFSVAFAADEDGSAVRVHSHWVPGMAVWAGTIDGEQVSVQVRPTLTGYSLAHRGVALKADVFTEREAELAALMPEKTPPDTSRMLLCPMPGLVVSIAVEEGQEVKAGETLAVVEAMKMENVLRAERDGVVSRIHAQPGASLAVDAVIMEFE
ncbi:acetyl/propionyl/methylcrotonyl-CoA carboxylase subunit alpha [Microbaculum marinum]|uniref:propionyl-CoA carboxylase n=1 Tax=Microbaculum marinum TaxID=1764581 RepID=A0AAW9RQV1_9HYPH